MDFPHEDGGGDLVKFDRVIKISHDFPEVTSRGSDFHVALSPVVHGVELGQFFRLQLFPGQDQPDHVFGKDGKGSQAEYFVPVTVHEFKNLREQAVIDGRPLTS